MIDEKKIYWSWDPALRFYHSLITKCYDNIESIQSSLWGKIFKNLAKKKLNEEFGFMEKVNGWIEERIKTLEEDGMEVVRYNSLTDEWLS